MESIRGALGFLAGLPGWIAIVAATLGATCVGWLCERLVARWARWARERTRSTWHETLAAALRGMPMVWFGTAAVYFGIRFAAYQDPWPEIVGTAAGLILIATFVLVAIRLATSGINRFAGRSSGVQRSTTLVQNVVKLLFLILGAALVLQNLGVNITTLVTALGISGLAVALALQDTLGNLFAGIQIIMSRQIRPGDYVALATGEEGAVTDIQARNTTIRTFPERNRVLVPNAILASTVVTNFSLPHKRLLITLPIGVSYDSDLEKVERVTVAVAREVLAEVEGGLTDEEPFVRFEEFSDFSINFLLRVPAREFVDQFLIRHELVKRLHRRYGDEGIEIPFPIRTVYMRERGGGRGDPGGRE